MGVGSSKDNSLVMRAVDSIGHGVTLEEAFLSLVEVLRGPLDLWHMSLSVLTTPADGSPGMGRYVAAWSIAPSPFEVGTEVSLGISDSAIAAAEALRRGKIVMSSVAAREDSLVDSLLREQGVASVAVVPIHGDAEGVLVLVVGSSAEGVLQSLGERFFRALVAGIEERVVELLRARAT
jgi:GAF domain-containing protein